jgi:hypothetical protein
MIIRQFAGRRSLAGLKVLLLTGFLPLLTGCPAASPPIPQPPELGPREVYTHEPSSFKFPAYVGSFLRSGVKLHDLEGQNVSAGYYLVQSVTITISVYPVPKEPPGDVLQSQLTISEEEFKKEHPDAKRTFEGPVNVQVSYRKRDGLRATFTYKAMHLQRQQLMHTDIYFFPNGNWLVKYVVTFPETDRESCELSFSAFAELFRWPDEPAKKPEEAKKKLEEVKKKPEEGTEPAKK